ncbi:hypothetical protein BJX65DRAFT_270240 [Aspergillus insuetus]
MKCSLQVHARESKRKNVQMRHILSTLLAPLRNLPTILPCMETMNRKRGGGLAHDSRPEQRCPSGVWLSVIEQRKKASVLWTLDSRPCSSPAMCVVLGVLPEACLRRNGFLRVSAKSHLEQYVAAHSVGLPEMRTPRKPPSSMRQQIPNYVLADCQGHLQAADFHYVEREFF